MGKHFKKRWKKQKLDTKDLRAIENWENYKTNYIDINGRKDVPYIQNIIENKKKSNRNTKDEIYEDDYVYISKPSTKRSGLHILVFPKIRIFNAITLQTSDLALIKYMNKIGKIIASLYLLLKNLNTPLTPTSLKKLFEIYPETSKNAENDLVQTYEHLNGYFHIYPRNTVNWLHLHILADNKMQKNKNDFPVEKIIEILEKK